MRLDADPFPFLPGYGISLGFVFRDPAFDYRLLIIGSIVPIGDGLFGGARALHSVTVSVALLAILMLATAGGRPVRKLLLGLPIGMLLHLVFDGAWSDTDVFWWPFTGLTFSDAPLPIVDRGVWSIAMEAVGIGLCWWLFRANQLGDAAARRSFLHEGRLRHVPGGP
jgi:hypothetical protein